MSSQGAPGVEALIIAFGALSSLGRGRAAVSAGELGAPAQVALSPDPELAAASLHRVLVGRVDRREGEGGDRATTLLALALGDAIAGLDEQRPGWRGERVGIALGTSSGGMLSAERFFEARRAGSATPALARAATYFAPFDDALAAHGLTSLARPEVTTQILAACAASTLAIGVGLRWLERGACDLVLAGGYDAISVFVAAGFEALRATTAGAPRPFRAGRDGMALGEGAGIVALVRSDDGKGARASGRIAGFGASNDAVHITAPDRTGAGLGRAGLAALADAGIDGAEVDLVSAHGTSTPYNDAMEAKAIKLALGEGHTAWVHPFKAQVGHTLGAAGVLETLAAADALARQVCPAAAGGDDGHAVDPEAPARLADRTEPAALRAALKLSAAFGGTDAALVLRPPSARSTRAPRGSRGAFVRVFARVEDAELGALAAATGIARDRLARLDVLCRLGLAAVARLASSAGAETLAGSGIVVGHALATLDTNEGFDARRRSRGPAGAEPRVFPATSPNALVGECAIAFRLTGPSFAVGAGLDGGVEALGRAAELVAAGDAERMVVVAADAAGPASRDLLRLLGLEDRPFSRGAVAALITAEPSSAGMEVRLDLAPRHRGDGPIGHLSLLHYLERLGGPGLA